MEKKLLVTSTPHIRSKDSVEKIMLYVVVALCPAALAGVFFFGYRALIILLLSIGFSVLFEAGFQKITNQPITISDFSAVVTGLLLGMNLPSSVPFWLPILGSFFAIVIVKQLYGGLGQNFMNPALASRAFLLISFSGPMTKWANFGKGFMYNMPVDAVSTATPLSIVKEGLLSGTPFVPTSNDLLNAFLGLKAGSIGETCAILLIAGGLFLIVKKVISWRIPVTYALTVLVISYLLGKNGLYEILIGGLMIGAFFMATDYSSSPVTANGQIIMGIGCGVLTALLRRFANYPETVSFAILLMNLAAPLIDKFTKPKVYGTNKEAKSI